MKDHHIDRNGLIEVGCPYGKNAYVWVVAGCGDNVKTRAGTWFVNNLLEMVVIVIVVALNCWWQKL
jgi:hypothetical protein